MEITQEHQLLIQNIVKTNNRFSGNEDLFEDFCSETIKRSYKVISSMSNITNLEGYLKKVATSAILEVLKTSGRLRRSVSGYTKTAEILMSAENIIKHEDTSYDNYLETIPDPSAYFEENLISKDLVNNVISQLYSINARNKEKNFITLFECRYVQGLKQSEIAEKMELSQGEVSKRLTELAKKITSALK